MKKSIFSLIIIFIFINALCFATETNLKDESGEIPSGEIISGEIINENNSGEETNNNSGETATNNAEKPNIGGTITNTESSNKSKNNIFLTIFEVVLLVFAIYKSLKYITESGSVIAIEPTERIKYSKELPFEGITPGQAVLTKDLNLTNKFGNVFAASLMSLQFKGAIEITNNGDKNNLSTYFIKLLDGKPALSSEELPVYEFLVEYINKFKKEDMTVSLAMLDKYILCSTERVSKLKDDMEKSIMIDTSYFNIRANQNKTNKIFESFSFTAIIVLMIALHRFNLSVFFLHTWISILSIINIALALRIANNCNVLNQAGANHREKLKALERYMLEFSSLKNKGVPELDIWNYYIIFALAFGISQKLIQQISACYPNIENSSFNDKMIICNALNKCEFSTGFMHTKRVE